MRLGVEHARCDAGEAIVDVLHAPFHAKNVSGARHFALVAESASSRIPDELDPSRRWIAQGQHLGRVFNDEPVERAYLFRANPRIRVGPRKRRGCLPTLKVDMAPRIWGSVRFMIVIVYSFCQSRSVATAHEEESAMVSLWVNGVQCEWLVHSLSQHVALSEARRIQENWLFTNTLK